MAMEEAKERRRRRRSKKDGVKQIKRGPKFLPPLLYFSLSC